MKQLAAGRDWAYAYEKALDAKLADHRELLEKGGDAPHQYIRGVIHGIDLAIDLLMETRSKHRQDGDVDFDN